MPLNPSLDQQLIAKIKSWLQSNKISQRELARYLKADSSNFTSWLSGSKTLSAEKMGSLLQLINLSPAQLAERLSVKTVHLEHFQYQSNPMRLDSNGGWVPGLSGDDPNNMGGDVTTVRSTGAEGGEASGDKITDVLRQVDLYHKQAREAIADWFANNQKAHPNAAGVTSGPRKISDNRKPGPRGDLL